MDQESSRCSYHGPPHSNCNQDKPYGQKEGSVWEVMARRRSHKSCWNTSEQYLDYHPGGGKQEPDNSQRDDMVLLYLDNWKQKTLYMKIFKSWFTNVFTLHTITHWNGLFHEMQLELTQKDDLYSFIHSIPHTKIFSSDFIAFLHQPTGNRILAIVSRELKNWSELTTSQQHWHKTTRNQSQSISFHFHRILFSSCQFLQCMNLPLASSG